MAFSWRAGACSCRSGCQPANGSEFGAGKLGHRPSDVASIYSDDDGRTWQCGETVVADGDKVDDVTIRNPSETVPVELSDGHVLFNIRSESAPNRRLIAVSPDGARDWRIRGWDEALLEPVCMGSIVRVGDAVVFANPDNLENELIQGDGHLAHDRKRLTVKLSEDECRTWTASRVLEAGPSGYSDLAATMRRHDPLHLRGWHARPHDRYALTSRWRDLIRRGCAASRDDNVPAHTSSALLSGPVAVRAGDLRNSYLRVAT